MNKHFLTALLIVAASPASAQSWSVAESGDVAIPASVGGAKLAGATMTCRDGAYFLSLPGVQIGAGTDSPVALLVDKNVFATVADGSSGDIAVPEVAIAALKSGSRLTLSFASGAMQVETSFALRGSSKALEALADRCQATQTAAAAPATPANPDLQLEFAPKAEAGGTIEVAFKGPGGNGDWIGLAPLGSSGATWLGNSYAYVSAGSPAKFPVPTAWGQYEVRYVTGANIVLLARTVEVAGLGGPTLEAPYSVAGGTQIKVGYSGPGGSDSFIAIARAEEPPTSSGSGGRAAISVSPATMRVPAQAGEWEIRYVAAGNVVAKRPLTVSEPPAVTIAAMETASGQPLTVALDDAPRTPGDYLYIARAGTPDADYGGGYVSIPPTGPASIAAPKEPGEWELRYVVPSGGTYVVLGRAALQVQ